MNHVPTMNRHKFLDLMFFYNFYSLHFSVGCISMIESPSEKEVQTPNQSPWGPKLGVSTVSDERFRRKRRSLTTLSIDCPLWPSIAGMIRRSVWRIWCWWRRAGRRSSPISPASPKWGLRGFLPCTGRSRCCRRCFLATTEKKTCKFPRFFSSLLSRDNTKSCIFYSKERTSAK